MEIQLLAHFWWELGLLFLSILFILLLALRSVSNNSIGKSGVLGSWGFISCVKDTPRVLDGAFEKSKNKSMIYYCNYNDWISTWVTRVFLTIVLLSAVIYLFSQCPGFRSPLWLGFVLQGFTYGSAYLFYVSDGNELADY